MIYDPLELTTELIKCRSVTPQNDGAIELLSEKLQKIGFNCEREKLFQLSSESSSFNTQISSDEFVNTPNFDS